MPVSVIEQAKEFQHTAARRRLGVYSYTIGTWPLVSTHSRPKAAGSSAITVLSCKKCFNTQPPEGGWKFAVSGVSANDCFNTQPPEGGWIVHTVTNASNSGFNTQPPEGGWAVNADGFRAVVFQHTAARRRLEHHQLLATTGAGVSTHSRPKAAGSVSSTAEIDGTVSTHSRPKAAGLGVGFYTFAKLFQHTAARRRLDI